MTIRAVGGKIRAIIGIAGPDLGKAAASLSSGSGMDR
jgi:hypothetical protein